MTLMERNYGMAALPAVALELAQVISGFKVVTFSGNLGAGKTTLIKQLCTIWGVQGNISSPTFSLVNQYATDNEAIGSPIYHIDLYRLTGEEEAYSAGIEDDLYSNHLCLVEWPEKAPAIIPYNALRVEIDYVSNDQRHIRVVSAEN